MVKTINRSDSQDNDKSDNSDSDTVTYNIINLPPIDSLPPHTRDFSRE